MNGIKKAIIFLIVLLGYSTFSAQAQDFEKEIDALYSFEMNTVPFTTYEQKLDEIQSFWNKIQSDTAKYLKLLRSELISNNHTSYFYADASTLLVMLSRAPSDRDLACEAIMKCNIEKLTSQFYVSTLHSWSLNYNVDVVFPAMRILQDKTFSYYDEYNQFKVNQGIALSYMLLPSDNKLYVYVLKSGFDTMNIVAQKSIITTIWFSHTCEGDEFLKSVAKNQNLDIEVSGYATRMLNYTKISEKEQAEFDNDLFSVSQDTRMDLLQDIHQESLNALVYLTKRMRTGTPCGSIIFTPN